VSADPTDTTTIEEQKNMFGASRTVGALAITIAGLLTLPATAMAEEGTSSPLLEVTTRSRYEPDMPSEPGETEIDIRATFLWSVSVTVSAHGATVLSAEPPAEEGSEFNSDPGELHTSFVPWSCKQPGTVYSYVVAATPGFGEEPPLTKTGSFAGASKRQCKEAPGVARRKHREEVREQRAEERRTLEEQLARDRLYEANCRKVGGKPVTIQTNEGPEIVCRSQTGGIVEA
jgi:hypothetical protein